MSENEQKKSNNLRNLSVAFASNVLACGAKQPFVVWQGQAGKQPALTHAEHLKRIYYGQSAEVATKGIQNFWRGSVAHALKVAPSGAAASTAAIATKNFLKEQNNLSAFYKAIIVGAIAGATESLSCYADAIEFCRILGPQPRARELMTAEILEKLKNNTTLSAQERGVFLKAHLPVALRLYPAIAAKNTPYQLGCVAAAELSETLEAEHNIPKSVTLFSVGLLNAIVTAPFATACVGSYQYDEVNPAKAFLKKVEENGLKSSMAAASVPRAFIIVLTTALNATILNKLKDSDKGKPDLGEKLLEKQAAEKLQRKSFAEKITSERTTSSSPEDSIFNRIETGLTPSFAI